MSPLSTLISLLRDQHVRLWEDDGNLKVSAPPGVLTSELTDELKQRKSELLAFLRDARPTRADARIVHPQTGEAPRPLSVAQERLWFLELLGGAGAAYNVAAAVRISGALDGGALAAAFEEVQRRHHVLRTRFVEVDGQPAQVTRPDFAPLDVTDWSHDASEQAAAAAEAEARADAQRPFNLAGDRLLRARLFRISPTRHLLAVTLHHLISDGLSLTIMVRELAELYRAAVSGVPSSLATPRFQFADFAAAQREWLHGESLERDVRYWRQQLAGAGGVLDLPADRPRPGVVSFNGATRSFQLAGEQARAVHRLAAETGATPFMILLAAYAVVLSRSAAQQEVIIGTPVANRSVDGADQVMGLFVNALPIRVMCAPGKTFAALVAEVRESVLAALAHGEVPWEYLLETLQPRRDLSRPPVFQVSFGLQDDPAAAFRLPGLTFEPVPLATGAAKFELSLEMQQTAAGDFDAQLEYNSDLFAEATAQRFADRFTRAVDRLAANATLTCSEIDFLDEAERTDLMRAWQGPSLAVDVESGLGQTLAERAARHPLRRAVVLGDRAMTFGELDAAARQVARALIDRGVAPGQVVGILAERTPETVAAIWGALYAGAAYVPLDPTWPERRLQQVMEMAACRVVACHAARAVRIGSLGVGALAIEDALGSAAAPGAALPMGRGGDAAYVLFTSGSTGLPKGVVIEQRSVRNLIAALDLAIYQPLGLGDACAVSVNAAFTFDPSVQQLFQLLCGRTVVLIPDELRLDGQGLLDYAGRTGIDVLDCTPSQLALFAEAGLGTRRGPVRAVFCGGEALTPSLWNRFRGPGAPRIVNLYAPTECTVDTTAHILRPDEDMPLLGVPMANMQVLVLDAQMGPVPIGMPGEIYIGGAGVGRGYLGDPELTRERFVANPFTEVSSPRLYRTGDSGRLRADGRFEYLGRLDHQVKVRGHRVELGEIERVLDQHGSVTASCALVVGEGSQQRLVAAVAAARETTPDQLRAHLEDRLPEYMVPAITLVLDQLPLSENGKIDRRALAGRDWTPATVVADEPLQGDEAALASLWQDVLGVPQVGPRDHFFRLGGHSLSAVRLASRVRDAFLVEFPVAAIFEQPVLRAMAAQLRARAAAAPVPAIVPVAWDGPRPLSFAQERMLFLEQLEGGGAAYVIAGAAELTGAVNVTALGHALQSVVAHHEVLRSVFPATSGAAEAHILETGAVLEEVDCSGTEGRADAHEWMRRRAAEPFDLRRDLPMRVALLRLADDRHLLFVVFHHIVSDGWSSALFVREMSRWYASYAGEGIAAPARPRLSYYDFARWQRDWLTHPRLERELAYWRQRLHGSAPFLDLPTDRPRPELTAYRGASLTFELTAGVRARVEEACRRLDSTPYMFLLAAFGALLHRWTGQRDVVIGSPTAGRNSAETEQVIGLFVNTLALRLDFDGSPRFVELVSLVRRATLEALSHQEVPFERVVEAVRPPRLLNRHPIFQVMFAHQNLPSAAIDLPGVSWRPVPIDAPTARFDLALVIDEQDGGYHCTLDYSADLFAPPTIARLADQFERLLSAVLENQDAALDTIDLTDAAALEQVRAWNRTERDYGAFVPAHHLVADQARRRPLATALSYRDTTITYADLRARAAGLAATLRAQGIGKGDIVAVCTDRSPAWVTSALAILEVGAVFLPVDPDYPPDRVRWMVEDSGAVLVVTQRRAWDQAGVAGARTLFVDKLESEITNSRDHEITRSSAIAPDDPAYLIYTSGSTGRPKGSLNTHRGLANLVRNQVELFETTPETKVLHLASISFDASIWELFMALAAGGTLCLADREQVLPGTPLADSLRRLGITHATLPPSVLGGMIDTECPALRVLIAAGEACTLDVVRRWSPGRRFFNAYGPSEAAVCATVSEARATDTRITIGRPLRNVHVYILDRQLQLVPAGMPGEICIGGAGVAGGYLGRPELTQQQFVDADPAGTGVIERLYRTGDQGRFLADGSIEFLGRRDQQVKLRGFRIELKEIEETLRRHPEVRDCAVVVQTPARLAARLAAFVVGEAGLLDRDAIARLKSIARARLPEYMVPAIVVPLDRLPQTTNGKLDRRALEQWAAPAAQDEPESTEPVTATTRVVAGIFAEVLERPDFPPHDDFFEHGGHSLLAARVIARVREALGAELTLRSLFEYPTPAALAGRVDAAATSALPPMVPSQRFEDRAVLSSAQRRLWLLDQLDGAQAAYNIVAAARLVGSLDLDAFRTAVDALSQRHEILRTVYSGDRGEPRVTLIDTPAALEIVQVEGRDRDDRWRHAASLAEADGNRPFDLAAGPLVRLVLYQVDPDAALLAVAMHHIVSDGHSVGVMVREVGELYRAAVQNDAPPPAPVVQYGDYARWMDQVLSGPALADELSFWTARLADVPSLLELPFDRPRPALQTLRGGSVGFAVAAPQAEALRRLAQRSQTTLYATLLSAFMAMLSRYSGQSQFMVGTPVANRRLREVEPLIGLFANTLILRARVDADEPFSALLGRVREETLDALSHPDVPFEALVGALQPGRNLSHTPLFQVMFAMTAGLVGRMQLPGVAVEPVPIATDSAKYDLTMFVDEADQDGGLVGTLEFQADLFDAATIERMTKNFVTLLEGITAAPDTAVGDLPLDPVEHARWREWNETATDRSVLTVAQLFEAQAVRRPDADAVVGDFGRLSYGDLDRRANQLAHELIARGVGRDVLVAVFLDRSPELIVSLLAVIKAGGAYVPIDIHYPAARVAFMLADSGARVVLTAQHLVTKLPGSVDALALDAEASHIAAWPASRPEVPADPSSLAYMIYTSGSTGTPKGVLIEHGGLTNYLVWAARTYRVHEGSGVPVTGSVSFDATITSLFTPLVAGQRLILVPEGGELEALADPAFAGAEHTFYKITTSHLDGMAALLGNTPLAGRVRELVLGGEPLTGASIEPWRHGAPTVIVTNEYGPTETVVGCTVFSAPAGRIPDGPTPIGRPIANTTIHLLDDRQRPVPIGAIGEIYIAGDGVARGYHNRPDLTAERFVELPAVWPRLKTSPSERSIAFANPKSSTLPGGANAPRSGHGDRIRSYRTGDLARWNGDGQLVFLGRRDGQVKLRGHRIELGEIESAARGCAGVANAAAVLQQPPGSHARLVLYVAAGPGQPISVDAIRERLQRELPPVMVPAVVRQLDELPLTPNGKLDRASLASLNEGVTVATAPVSRDQVRDLLAGLWASLLGAPPDAADADFFSAGGHSLLAARLTARIRDAFGVSLPLRTVFEHPTWDGLSQQVAAARSAGRALPPIEPGDDEPVLSFGQQRLWVLEQLENLGPAYHIPAAFRLRGPLDPDALDRAWQDVTRRHQVLRASFPIADGRPAVRIAETGPPLTRADLRGAGSSTAALDARLQELTVTPFDLAEGPLVRAALYRLDTDEWVFALVLHHLVTDGWSSAILAHELRDGYARHTGRGAAMPPALPIQYADYARWQRQVLSGDAIDRLTAFWMEALRGAPPAIELPVTGTRASVQNYRGGVVEFQIPAGMRDRLLALARSEDATLYMVLLSAYSALLSLWSGQQDVVIGSPVANRSQLGTEALVGFFVNTIPLRVRLEGAPSFRELLRRVRDTALHAFDHQDLPFERLVDAIKPPRNPAFSPIFQVLFSYQQADAADLVLPGIAVEPIRVPHAAAKFDVSLAIDDRASGLHGFFEYAADLFDRDAIRGMGDRFVLILEAMLAGLEHTVGAAPMLTPPERAALAGWNDTARDFGEARLIHEMIEDQARQTPDATALEFDDGAGRVSLTYAELNARADRVARELTRAGVGPDSAVGICLERSLELLVAVLGILKAGGGYVPLDPEYPPARLAGMWEDAGLRILISRQAILDRGLFGGASAPATVLALEPGFWTAAEAGGQVPRAAVTAANLAYIIFTSGSTGRPKGAVIEHGAIRNRLLWMQDQYRLDPSDVVLQKTPVSFDVSVWELFWPLMFGARLVIARPGGHRDGAYLMRLIAETGVTTLHFVPSMLQVFLEEPGLEALRSLRRVFASGEALPWETVRRFQQRIACPLHNLYGPTEAAVDVTFWECQTDGENRSIPIGRPIANTRIHVLDAHLNAVPIGVAGELYIGGVNLARGYVNQPAMTAERFVANPFAAGDPAESARLYRTGDSARWRADGQVEYLGRLDAQVKLRGFRVELGEIDTALMQHPGIAEAAAAVVGEAGHQRLVGYLVPRTQMPDVDALRRHLQDRLPEYMVPSAFVALSALPLGATGKLDRKALPPPAISGSAARVPAGTPAERALAAIWEEVLGVPDIGRNQNFFDLGGDSILAIQMAARARRAGLAVSPGLLLEHQTVATLTEAALASRPISAEQGTLEGELPAAPAVHWFAESAFAVPQHFNQAIVLSTAPGLDADVLARALHLLAEHHDALRVRTTGFDRRATLRFGPAAGSFSFEAIDGAAARDIEAKAAAMQASLDPVQGPAWRTAYFPGRGGQRGRFVWVAHHLIVDGVSWGILVDDLEQACRQLTAGRIPALPPKTSSGRQWTAAWQSPAGTARARQHASFWTSLPFADAVAAPTAAAHRAATTTRDLDAATTRSVAIEWPRRQRATGQDVLLAALATSWSRQFGDGAMAVHLEGHGRVAPSPDIDVSRTVGWFTAVYPLVIAINGAAADRLQQVRNLTASVPDGGAGFGVLKYLAGDPEVSALPRPQLLVNYLGTVDEAGPPGATFGPAAEHSGPPSDPRNRSPYAIEVSASIADARLTLYFATPEGGVGQEVITRLADDTIATLASWAAAPSTGDAASADPSVALAATGYTPLVRLRRGLADAPPLFLVHPAGGSVIPYRQLSERLAATCYGLQAPGLAEGETPIDSLDALVDLYTAAIIEASPEGPYRLGGWSFGGVVAFAIARRLRAQGRTVGLVAVLDTWAPAAMPAVEWEKDSAQLMADIFGEDTGVTRGDLAHLDLEGQLAAVTERAIAAGVFPAGFSVDAARRAWHVYQAARRAERAYAGAPYDGDLLLFVSAARGRDLDPLLGWGRFAGRVTVQRVAGNHQQILRVPSVDLVAARLQQD